MYGNLQDDLPILSGKQRTMFGPLVLKLTFVFAITGHGIDLGSTQNCIGARRCTELNPFLLRFENPIGFSVAKMGLAGATEVVIYDFSKKYTKEATLTNIAIGTVFTYIGFRNYNLTKE